MTETSARFDLPLLQAGQAQKEVFHNEAIVRLDALIHPAVEGSAQGTPPGDPASGQSWIVASGATGAWMGQAGRLATWTTGGWRFTMPVAGMMVWVESLDRWAWHDGDSWQTGPTPTAGVMVNGVRVVGAQQSAITGPTGGTTVDLEVRTALAAVLDALRMHGLIAT